jgi:hypothetical protein
MAYLLHYRQLVHLKAHCTRGLGFFPLFPVVRVDRVLCRQ